MVSLRELEVQNLYSFAKRQMIRFSELNYVVGHNNSGKTNVTRIFKLIERTLRLDEPLALSDRHLRSKRESNLKLKVVLNEEEAKLIFLFISFPYNLDEAKNDLKDLSDKITPFFRILS
jgi:AAA15 family ATPase/GTPase